MKRLEGPTKTQVIADLVETLDRIGALVETKPPAIHSGMWYNIDRSSIDQLNEFLLIVEGRLPHAVDS